MALFAPRRNGARRKNEGRRGRRPFKHFENLPIKARENLDYARIARKGQTGIVEVGVVGASIVQHWSGKRADWSRIVEATWYELRVIEYIQELSPQIDPHPLSDVEVFEEGQIDVVDRPGGLRVAATVGVDAGACLYVTGIRVFRYPGDHVVH